MSELVLSNLSLKESEIVDFCINELKLSSSKKSIINNLVSEYKGYSKEKLEKFIDLAHAKIELKYKNEGIASIVIDHIEKYEKIYEDSIKEGNDNINSPERDERKYAREQYKLALQANMRQETVLGAIGVNSKGGEYFKEEEDNQKDTYNFAELSLDQLVQIKNSLDKYTISTPQGIRERVDKAPDPEVLNDSNCAVGMYKEIEEIMKSRKNKIIINESDDVILPSPPKAKEITDIDRLINADKGDKNVNNHISESIKPLKIDKTTFRPK